MNIMDFIQDKCDKQLQQNIVLLTRGDNVKQIVFMQLNILF